MNLTPLSAKDLCICPLSDPSTEAELAEFVFGPRKRHTNSVSPHSL